MQQPFVQYSHPYLSYDDRIDEMIIASHATAITQQLVARLQDPDAQQGLVDYVLSNLGLLQHSPEPFWDVSFGRAQRTLDDHSLLASDAIALIALRMAQFGAKGSCYGRLSTSFRMIWGNRLLPAMDAFFIQSANNNVLIKALLHEQQQFVATKNDSSLNVQLFGNNADRKLQNIGGILLLPADAMLHDVIVEDDFHSIFSYPDIDAQMVEDYERAFALLEQAPEYAQWVRRILRGIVVCETTGSRTRSSSWSEAPGVVLISHTAVHHLTAEMLVHESSHQYFNLVCRCGEPVNDASDQLYYSPAVDRPRPIKKILLGYHAFANMYLFYHQIKDVPGVDRAAIRDIITTLDEKLKLFEEPLLTQAVLSDIGESLFQPLYHDVCAVRDGQHHSLSAF